MPRHSERQSGLALSVFLAAIAFIFWVLFDLVLWPLLALAAIGAIVALSYPIALLPLNRLWNMLAHRLAIANTYLLLGFVLFLLLLPARMVLKLVGSDPMQRRWKQSKPTYFQPVVRRVDKETYRDQF